MIVAISVVTTVRDDHRGLAELLEALARQQRLPDEVVIVEAGNGNDDALLEQWRERGLQLRLLRAPGAGISAGRNVGIEAAANERIAVTDAGCRPQPGWVAALVDGLERSEFVAGVYTVDHATPLEHAIAVSLYPDVHELPRTGLFTAAWQQLFGRRFTVRGATGRSMGFTRAAWRAAGCFPEAADSGEDVAFSAAVVDSGVRSELSPEAIVAWRGRLTWAANARMYYRYAFGDAVFGRSRRSVARALAWLVVLSLSGLQRRHTRIGRPTVATVWLVAYSSLPLARARRTGLSWRHWWRIPVALVLKDAAMVAGAVVGSAQRAVNGQDDEHPPAA